MQLRLILTGLNNNTKILNGPFNTTFASVAGENKTVIIMTINQDFDCENGKKYKLR